MRAFLLVVGDHTDFPTCGREAMLSPVTRPGLCHEDDISNRCQKAFGALLRVVHEEPVQIRRNGRIVAVAVSPELYRELVGGSTASGDAASDGRRGAPAPD